jgi:hypothetical protein
MSILCVLLISCSDKSSSENITSSTYSSNKTVKFINQNQNIDKNKLAFIFETKNADGEVLPLIVTFETDIIDNSSSFKWNRLIGNDSLKISRYNRKNIQSTAFVNQNFSISIDTEYGRSTLNEIIADNGSWFMTKSTQDNFYHIYHQLELQSADANGSTTPLCLSFTINKDSDQEALSDFEIYKKAVRVYYPNGGKYLNVLDQTGKMVSLNDYLFFSDIVASILAVNGINIDSIYVTAFTSDSVTLEIPYKNGDKFIKYDISIEKSGISSKDNEQTFKLNETEIKMRSVSNESSIFTFKSGDDFILIKDKFPNLRADTKQHIEEFINNLS